MSSQDLLGIFGGEYRVYANHGRSLVTVLSAGKGLRSWTPSVSLLGTRSEESKTFAGFSSFRIFSIEKFRLGLASALVIPRFFCGFMLLCGKFWA